MAQPIDHVRIIAEESARFAAVLPDDLSSPVPTCPAWDTRALVEHLGEVQRFWAVIIEAGGAQPQAIGLAEAPEGRSGLLEWFADGTRQLVEAIARVAPEAPAWTWWGDPATAGAVARHQVQEAAVHRVDAELVTGPSTPIAADIADDGVPEFLQVMLDVPAGVLPPAVRFQATDTGSEWTLGSDPVVALSGSASDLVLALYGRISLDGLAVEGDRETAERLLTMTSVA
jgi:uncharacterized protein (TIGR03083 family)